MLKPYLFKVSRFSTSAKSLFCDRAQFSKIIAGITPIALGVGTLPSWAQTASSTQTLSQSPSETICAYDADSGFPNPLGSRASLTVETSQGDTAFIYERLPAVVSSDSSDLRAEVDNKRTLTIFETPLETARQLLIDDSSYYAVLLGLAPDDDFIARGFEMINQTLTCETGDTETSSVPTPATQMPPVPQPLETP